MWIIIIGVSWKASSGVAYSGKDVSAIINSALMVYAKILLI